MQNNIRQTIQVMSEGIKYEAEQKSRKDIEKMLEKIISNSIFLDNEKKRLYLLPIYKLDTSELLEFKNIFIRRNLAYLKYLVENKLVEKRIIAELS